MVELNAPDALVSTYWNLLKDEMGEQTEAGLKEQVRTEGPDSLRAMSNFLYDTRFKHRMSREEYDTQTGMKQWEDDQPGIIGNTIEAVKGFFTDEEGNKRAIADTYWNTYGEQIQKGGTTKEQFLAQVEEGGEIAYEDLKNYMKADQGIDPASAEAVQEPVQEPGVIAAPGQEQVLPAGPPQPGVIREDIPNQAAGQIPTQQPTPEQQGPGVKATAQDALQLDPNREQAGARTPNRDLPESDTWFGNTAKQVYNATQDIKIDLLAWPDVEEFEYNQARAEFRRKFARFDSWEGREKLKSMRDEAVKQLDKSAMVDDEGNFSLTGLIDLFKGASEEDKANIKKIIDIDNGLSVLNAGAMNWETKETYWRGRIEQLEGTKYDVQPRTTFEDVKENVANAPAFIIEAGIASLPWMALAGAVPAYVLALAGSIGGDRTEHDEREQIRAKDLLAATPWATVIAASEFIGLGWLFRGASRAVSKNILTKGDAVKEVVKTIGRETVLEAEQGFLESLGGYIDTETWKKMSGIERFRAVGEATVIEGMVGGVFGGGIIGGGVIALTYEKGSQNELYDPVLNQFADMNRNAVDLNTTQKTINRMRRDLGRAMSTARKGGLSKEKLDIMKELDTLQRSFLSADDDFETSLANYEKFQNLLRQEIWKRREDVSVTPEFKPKAEPEPTVDSLVKKIKIINDKFNDAGIMDYPEYIEENAIVDSVINDAINSDELSEEDRAVLEDLKQAREVAQDPDLSIDEKAEAIQTMQDIIYGPPEEAPAEETAPEETVETLPEEQALPEAAALPEETAPEEITPAQPTETPTETPAAIEVPDNPTIEGKVLEERQKLGNLFEIPIEDVSDGDSVTVDVKDGNPPVSGIITVETITLADGTKTKLASIKDKAGDLLTRFRIGPNADPTKPAPSIYASQTSADPEEKSILDEINRLILRTETDPNAFEEITRIRKSGDFRKLSEEERDRIDDYIRDNAPVEEGEQPAETKPVEETTPEETVEKPKLTRKYEELERAGPVNVVNINFKDTEISISKYGTIEAYNNGPLATRDIPEFDGTPAENTAALLKAVEQLVPEGSSESNVIFEQFDNDLFDMDALADALDDLGVGFHRVDHDLNGPDADMNHDWLITQEPKPVEQLAPVETVEEDAPEETIEEAPAEETAEEETFDEAETLTATTPTGQLATKVEEFIANNKGKKLTNESLFNMGAEVYGGTMGEGKFDAQQAYNSLELAINKIIASTNEGESQHEKGSLEFALEKIDKINEQIDLMPTQTLRTEDKIKYQQFSTPPAYAYAINWIANVRKGDKVLEPSAGNGGLAVFARDEGAEVTVNEIDKKRAQSLEMLGFKNVYKEDAEHLSNIIDDKFDLVIMNPPFSAAGKRGVSNTSAIGAQHVLQAFKLLKPGGRMVIITGQGFTPHNRLVMPMFKTMRKQGQFRAITGIAGDKIYRKYGTSFDNKLIIFDKTGIPDDDAKTLGGHYESLSELITALEEIRNDRPQTDQGGRVVEDGAGAAVLQTTPEGGSVVQPTTSGTILPVDTKLPGKKPEPDIQEQATDNGRGNSGTTLTPDSKELSQVADSDAVGGGDINQDNNKPNDTKTGKPPRTDRPTDTKSPDVKPVADNKGVKSQTKVGGSIKIKNSGGVNSHSAIYKPPFDIEFAPPHLGSIVEPVALAISPTPDMHTALIIPPEKIKAGILSDVQLTAVLLAVNSHERILPDGKRQGFMIGDGTGLGKGREIMGIILDNWLRGRKKSIWISKSAELYFDADRDIKDVDSTIPLHNAATTKGLKNIKDQPGVIFTTYSTLRAAEIKNKNNNSDSTGWPMVDHLVQVLGKDFDGVIAFDESHAMGGSIDVMTNRGKKKATGTGKSGRALREAFPNARILYVSATSATKVENLSYLERLGLWGEGTAFPTIINFLSEIEKGGTAGLEVVAQYLKQTGRYIARSISYEGVENVKLQHKLTPEQREIYDATARVWQSAFSNLEAIVADIYGGFEEKDQKRAMSRHMSHFWGSNQRFYNQLLTSMNMPTVLKQMHASIAAGHAPVVQMVSTNEAQTKRAIKDMQEGDTYDDLDSTPRQMLMSIIDRFPVHEKELVIDEDGNEIIQTVYDSKGNPVENREAVLKRESMRIDIRAMSLPDAPIDMIINEFGKDNVAEVTGRISRVVRGKDGKNIVEPRSKTIRTAEAKEFQNGDRKVLIFTEAGGTGFSYHASREVKNQKRRAHFVLQPGWRADIAIQGLGRTNRTNQVSAPIVYLVGNDTRGSIRFLSAIAARMETLGAVTQGSRHSTNTAMDAPDVEGKYGVIALRHMFTAIAERGTSVSPEEIKEKMGINLLDADGRKDPGKIDDLQVKTFLNRVLNLSINDQEMIYDSFASVMEDAIELAKKNGVYDSGLEVIDPISAKIVEDKVIHTEAVRGGETKYINVEIQVPNKILEWDVLKMGLVERAVRESQPGKFYKRKDKKGKVYFMKPYISITMNSGAVMKRLYRHSVDTSGPVMENTVNLKNYDELDSKTAEKLWKLEEKKIPTTKSKNVHLITGSLLDVYDSLPKENIKLVRVMLGKEDSILGRQIDNNLIDAVLTTFGHAKNQVAKGVLDAETMIDMLFDGDATHIRLNNEVLFRKVTVFGEERIQVSSKEFQDTRSGGVFQKMGFIFDVKDSKGRIFLPNGPDGIKILERYMARKWVTSVMQGDIDVKYHVPYTSPDRVAKDYGPSIEDDLRALIDKLAPSIDGRSIELRINDGPQISSGVKHSASFRPLGNLKSLIQVSMNTKRDPREQLRHEVIHALKEYKLFTNQEWDALVKSARDNDWLSKHEIETRYPFLYDDEGQPTEAAIEEAIADEFANYIDKKIDNKTPSIIKKVFQRMFEFFSDLTGKLRGYGAIPKVDNIFDTVESGEVGRRALPKKQYMRMKKPDKKQIKHNVDSDTRIEIRKHNLEIGKEVKWGARISEATKEQYRRMTRTWEGIPHDVENTTIRDKLTHLMAAHKSAENEINSLFKQVMGGLNAREIETLTMKMILDDLLYTAEKGMKIPFGLDGIESVLNELQQVEAELAGNPKLIERLDIRTKFTADIRLKMIESGVLTEEQAKNPNYFRHQIIEFAIARENKKSGGGGARWSSYWHRREGSEKSFNTNYFQAEADWLYKAFNDVATAQFINWLRKSKHNKKPAYVTKAKNANKALMLEIVAANKKGRIYKADVRTRQNVAIAWKYFEGALLLNSKVVEMVPEHLKSAYMSIISRNKTGQFDESYRNKKYQLLQFFMKKQVEGISNTAAAVMGAMNNRRVFVRSVLGDEYINPMSAPLLAKLYGDPNKPITTWQHESRGGERRMRLFTGQTISEHVLKRVVDEATDPKNKFGVIDLEEHAAAFEELRAGIKSAIIMGGPMEEMIIPEGIARTLDEFHDKEADSIVGDLSAQALNGWKRYILFNPLSFPKYVLNNYVGDTDALIRAGNFINVHKIIPRAHGDVIKMIYKGVINDDLRMANEYGVISTTQTGQEIDRQTLDSPVFRDKISLASLKKPLSLTWRGTKKYFEVMQTVAQVREAAYRYAVFLNYIKEFTDLRAGKKTLLDIGYGASNPAHIQSMLQEGVSTEEIAAKMAREVMGDYGAVPQTARAARHRLVPFVSWIASNTVRYNNFLANTYREARDIYRVNRNPKDVVIDGKTRNPLIHGAVKGGVLAASTTTMLSARLIGLYTVFTVWNHVFFPDEEDLLTDYARSKMHAILGLWNGFIITLNINGGFSDWADWFNLDELISMWRSGTLNALDAAISVAKGPFNKLGNSLSPMITIPIEMFSKQTFFPDIFNSRTTRNRVDTLAKNFRLGYPVAKVKEIMGYLAPTPGILDTMITAIVRLETPQSLTYTKWRALSFKFEEQETGESISSHYSPRGAALYAWKQYGKYGDKKGQEKAYEQYIELGGSRRRFKSALKAAGPLGNLSSKQRRKFLSGLTDSEREQVAIAEKWWNDNSKR